MHGNPATRVLSRDSRIYLLAHLFSKVTRAYPYTEEQARRIAFGLALGTLPVPITRRDAALVAAVRAIL